MRERIGVEYVDLARKFGRERPRSVRRAAEKAQGKHVVPAPIEDDAVAAHVATILLNGTAMSEKIKALSGFLAPLGLSKQAILAAMTITSPGSNHRAGVPDTAVLPNNQPGKHGLASSTDVMKAARRREAYFRAGYVVNAATRIQAELDDGVTVRTALADESLNYRSHEKARRNRLDNAAKASKAATLFGPVLGWYLNPSLNNERECIAANGHNFNATLGTVIGYPGSVHPNCGCVAGPPHAGGMDNSVDKAVARHITFGEQRTYKPKAS